MSTLVAGLFTEGQDAGDTIAELKNKGYVEAISLVAKDGQGEVSSESVKTDTAGGASTGAGIGALAGAVTGVVSAILPGASLLVAGPVAVLWGVTGAALGALSGGLLGALVSLGFEEEEAKIFEDRILAGDVLVAVTSEEDREQEIVDIMERNNVYEIVQLIKV